VLSTGRRAENSPRRIYESVDMGSITIKLPQRKSIFKISGRAEIPTPALVTGNVEIIHTSAATFSRRNKGGWTLQRGSRWNINVLFKRAFVLPGGKHSSKEEQKQDFFHVTMIGLKSQILCHNSIPLVSHFVLNSPIYSTVTDLARLRGWSTLQPRITAM
jgi:hypothetical protein